MRYTSTRQTEAAAAALYSALVARRAEIEAVYGSPLEFQELPGKRACRIVEYGNGEVKDLNGTMSSLTGSSTVANDFAKRSTR